MKRKEKNFTDKMEEIHRKNVIILFALKKLFQRVLLNFSLLRKFNFKNFFSFPSNQQRIFAALKSFWPNLQSTLYTVLFKLTSLSFNVILDFFQLLKSFSVFRLHRPASISLNLPTFFVLVR